MLTFSQAIEEIVYMKDISYIDAIVHYCEETGFEPEIAANLVSEALREKIQIEAEDLHFIPKSNTAKLPF